MNHSFHFMTGFYSHRLLCCTPLDCKKNIGQFKAVEVCVYTHSFTVSLLDYLVSRENCLPFVAVAKRKSINVVLWAHGILTAFKMFMIRGVSLYQHCFIFCVFNPEKNWNSVVRIFKVCWGWGMIWRMTSSTRKRQTTGELKIYQLGRSL